MIWKRKRDVSDQQWHRDPVPGCPARGCGRQGRAGHSSPPLWLGATETSACWQAAVPTAVVRCREGFGSTSSDGDAAAAA